MLKLLELISASSHNKIMDAKAKGQLCHQVCSQQREVRNLTFYIVTTDLLRVLLIVYSMYSSWHIRLDGI